MTSTVTNRESGESDWTPRKQFGGIYCSPRCGGKCTQAAHDKAVADSTALCARLGAGWAPDVWENLGWHWRVKKDLFEVHACHDGTFSAWFQGEKQFIAHADTPEDALGFVTQDIRTFIRRIENELERMPKGGEG